MKNLGLTNPENSFELKRKGWDSSNVGCDLSLVILSKLMNNMNTKLC